MQLGDRMKRYELASKGYLTRRMPVIIRIDGKAFHTVAKRAIKPFDEKLEIAMAHTAQKLVELLQGCVFAYGQSDEISLLLIDYYKLESEAWFDYNIQKLCSVSASIATAWFNYSVSMMPDLKERLSCLPALFDARAFNVPVDDVTNYFIWRQQDAERNSIQSFARSFYSQKECHKHTCKMLISKIIEERGIDWADLPIDQKRGYAIRYCPPHILMMGNPEYNIPRFTQDREYIDSLLRIPVEEKAA